MSSTLYQKWFCDDKGKLALGLTVLTSLVVAAVLRNGL